MELTDLDRRIVGALMARLRASWRTIAGALKAPERTVARRGAELLASGVVQVVGILSRIVPVLVLVRAAPGTVRVGARAVAAREDTSFVYEITGAADCVVELLSTHETVASVLSEELPSVLGVQHIASNPILRYFKTLKDWQPGLLGPDEVAALGPVEAGSPPRFGHSPALDGRVSTSSRPCAETAGLRPRSWRVGPASRRRPPGVGSTR